MAHGDTTLTRRIDVEATDGDDRKPVREPIHLPLVQRLKQPRNALNAALAIGLVIALVALAMSMYSVRKDDSRWQEAMDTAREYSVFLSSFDYQNLDANKDKIASMSTEEFAGTYRTMVDSLREVVADGQGQATATAVNVGIERIDDTSATVLVFADQEAKNVATPQGNSQKYRMLLSLVRSNDQWLVNNVETK